jgi:hypothetical protein
MFEALGPLNITTLAQRLFFSSGCTILFGVSSPPPLPNF